MQKGKITFMAKLSMAKKKSMALGPVVLYGCLISFFFRTMFLITLFSQYLKNIQIPIPAVRTGEGCTVMKLPIFKLFPVSYFSSTLDG